MIQGGLPLRYFYVLVLGGMMDIKKSFLTGYDEIVCEYTSDDDTLYLHNVEYGYVLKIEQFSKCDLSGLYDIAYQRQTTVDLYEGYWLTVAYEDGQYLICEYDEPESCNILLLTDSIYHEFLDMLDCYKNNIDHDQI